MSDLLTVRNTLQNGAFHNQFTVKWASGVSKKGDLLGTSNIQTDHFNLKFSKRIHKEKLRLVFVFENSGLEPYFQKQLRR